MQTKQNLAARAGRWSAAHWKTATVAWLVFVVLGDENPVLAVTPQGGSRLSAIRPGCRPGVRKLKSASDEAPWSPQPP
ncbi:MAG: hypothetical protein QOF43_1765 [Gaiellaceae bacterium]|nr:hypothetical protein [Gaiellaceae bacterium]